MGTGKTLAALMLGKLMYDREGWHTVVVARANLCENWRREASGCGHRVVSIFAHAKIPESHNAPYVLIVDECHDMQSMQSIRTKKFMALALAPHCHGGHCYQRHAHEDGQPKNIFPLLKACRHPLGDNQAAFEKRLLRGPG